MSKRCKPSCEPCCCGGGYGGYGGYGGFGGGSYSNIYSLLILILIVCQFCGKCGKWWGKDDDCDDDGCVVDNSILFIIAIFVLIYCSCGKSIFGGNQGCC